MSLKELTAEKHQLAETTQFMKAVFAKNLPKDLWIDFTYQKYIWYTAIENSAFRLGLLKDLPGIQRANLIMDDYHNMNGQSPFHIYKQLSKDYADYICTLTDPKRVLAHLYTWHMGDMFGGQMIAKIIPGSHSHLVFENRDSLIATMRSMLDDSMGDEANVAFDWAIKIMRDYDNSLG